MKRALPLLLLALISPACASRRPAAQAGGPSPALATTTSCPSLPDSLLGYRLTGSHVFPDASLGTGYRFSGPPGERVTVFVYPITAEKRTGADVQAWVTAEGRTFLQTFPAGVQRGWYQSYADTIAHAEPVTFDGGTVPGFLAGAATKTNGRIAVELQYVYAVCEHFVKVRATLDGATWENSNLPNFAKALAARLARQ